MTITVILGLELLKQDGSNKENYENIYIYSNFPFP